MSDQLELIINDFGTSLPSDFYFQDGQLELQLSVPEGNSGHLIGSNRLEEKLYLPGR